MRCEKRGRANLARRALRTRLAWQWLAQMATALFALPAMAQGTPAHLDSGDTAWMITASMLVLMMTLPGAALFYGGMVRAKNLLSVMMQCFAITALVTVLWVCYGYSLAFSTEGMRAGATNWHSIVGGLDHVMLAGLTPNTLYQTVPESVL